MRYPLLYFECIHAWPGRPFCCKQQLLPQFGHQNSLTDVTTVNLPKDAQVYALAGKDGMRSTVMTLNGDDLVLGENDELPDLSGKAVPAGTLEIAPGSCTFIVL